ncbi:MAG TPA: phosphatidylserine/phosphatidylglycerophosphate/cardiolipin synthase family protein [Kofleriaceae bacterium]
MAPYEPRPTSDGVPRAIYDDAPSRAIAVPLPPTLAVYARSLLRWRPSCEVTVLREGAQTYPAMLEAIAAAKKMILFEVYIFAADGTGEKFRAALLERAKAGVKVRIIYDAVGSFGIADSWFAELVAAGAEVIDFNPIAPWRARFRLSHRDHRKIIVVDDAVAFTGGLNIADDYAATVDGGKGWHDMHCRVRGGAVLDLARLFRRTWLRAGGAPYPAPGRASEAPAGPGESYARVIENTKIRQRGAFRRAYLHVIKHARESVLIENAYFLPERAMRRQLTRAVKRGVRVAIIIPGHSDVRMVEYAGEYVLRRLAKRGVEILRYQGAMMHAKIAVVDGLWSTIGSYNFDAQSRLNNLEVTVEILDPKVGTELVAQFEQSRAKCIHYDEAAWLRLPWYRKVLSWVSYRLRRFL